VGERDEREDRDSESCKRLHDVRVGSG
jgi:hypothetical protein